MSEFEFSTLGMLAFLLAALGGYSYWQVYRAKRAQRKRDAIFEPSVLVHDEYDEMLTEPVEPKLITPPPSPAKPQWAQTAKPLPWQSERTPVSVRAPVMTERLEPAPSSEQNITFYVDESKPEIEAITPASDVQQIEVLPIDSVMVETSPEISLHQVSIEPEWAQASVNSSDLLESNDEGLKASESNELADVQFFSQQDESEHAALTVFDPLMRFATWMDAAQPAPIQSIDGVVDVTLSQPKLMTDIERALYDLRLNTDLPLRLLGRRAGHEIGAWTTLEPGVLYSGLRLTLQLANKTVYADAALIQEWFVLTQKFVKRLAATVQAWPDPAALASYAVYLHDLAQHLSAPVIVQLHKPTGLWPAYEVHQHMTQWGISLSEQGQYLARAEGGKVLYSVLNDINNPHAQDFSKDALPSMHANTLSFCLDLARTDAVHKPSLRLWHDMHHIAQGLQAQWCNAQGVVLDVPALMNHAEVQISAYYEQLSYLNIPAGSMLLRRLLRG